MELLYNNYTIKLLYEDYIYLYALGPVTEYGCLLIVVGKQSEILHRGSIDRSILRTLSLV